MYLLSSRGHSRWSLHNAAVPCCVFLASCLWHLLQWINGFGIVPVVDRLMFFGVVGNLLHLGCFPMSRLLREHREEIPCSCQLTKNSIEKYSCACLGFFACLRVVLALLSFDGAPICCFSEMEDGVLRNGPSGSGRLKSGAWSLSSGSI